MTQKPVCAIYIRKSRDKKDHEAYRLEVQRERLPEYAAAQGWESRIYDEGVLSGADNEKMPQMQLLISDMNAGKINIILTIELSRLSRDDTLIQYVEFIDICKVNNVKISTPTVTYRPWEPAEFAMLIMQGNFSTVEMLHLKKRFAEGRMKAKDKGAWLGGRANFGYMVNRDKNAPPLPIMHPEHGRTMKFICELAKYHSSEYISERLIEKCYKTATNKLTWTPRIVRGYLCPDSLRFISGQTRNSNDEWIKAQWEPLISIEDFHQIMDAIKYRNHKSSNGTMGKFYLLTCLKIYRCGYCGKTMSSNVMRKNRSYGIYERRYYICSDRYYARGTKRRYCRKGIIIDMDMVDGMVLQDIIARLTNLHAIERGYKFLLEKSRKHQPQIEEIERYRAILQEEQKKVDRLVDAVANGDIDGKDAKAKMNVIKEEKSRISRIIFDLESASKVNALELANIKKVTDAGLLSRFPELPLQEKKEFIFFLVSNIKQFSNQLVIEYRFPIDGSGNFDVILPVVKGIKPRRKLSKIRRTPGRS